MASVDHMHADALREAVDNSGFQERLAQALRIAYLTGPPQPQASLDFVLQELQKNNTTQLPNGLVQPHIRGKDAFSTLQQRNGLRWHVAKACGQLFEEHMKQNQLPDEGVCQFLINRIVHNRNKQLQRMPGRMKQKDAGTRAQSRASSQQSETLPALDGYECKKQPQQQEDQASTYSEHAQQRARASSPRTERLPALNANEYNKERTSMQQEEQLDANPEHAQKQAGESSAATEHLVPASNDGEQIKEEASKPISCQQNEEGHSSEVTHATEEEAAARQQAVEAGYDNIEQGVQEVHGEEEQSEDEEYQQWEETDDEVEQQ